jgi:hypothetical protein
MTFEEFKDHIQTNGMYETIYRDSEGRDILVICLLDAYGLLARTPRERPWVGLTADEHAELWYGEANEHAYGKAVEALLRKKNT